MTGIILRNKRINEDQFVFAGGGKRKPRTLYPHQRETKDATTTDDKYDNPEIPAALPCFSGERKPGDSETVATTSTETTVAKLFVPRWMSQSSSKDDTEHQANARQTAKTALQRGLTAWLQTDLFVKARRLRRQD